MRITPGRILTIAGAIASGILGAAVDAAIENGKAQVWERATSDTGESSSLPPSQQRSSSSPTTSDSLTNSHE